ncbi:MAG: hypothetical protein AAF639_45850, partial [Chloroflexota bacterium]
MQSSNEALRRFCFVGISNERYFMNQSAYQQLSDHFQRIGDLRHVQAITGWDEAAMMPQGGGAARGAALTTL